MFSNSIMRKIVHSVTGFVGSLKRWVVFSGDGWGRWCSVGCCGNNVVISIASDKDESDDLVVCSQQVRSYVCRRYQHERLIEVGAWIYRSVRTSVELLSVSRPPHVVCSVLINMLCGIFTACAGSSQICPFGPSRKLSRGLVSCWEH